MSCPGPEQAAAYADGRLDAAEAARFLEHCSDCDDCRHCVAVLVEQREPDAVPADAERKAIAAVRRALGHDRVPKPRRQAPEAPAKRFSPLGYVLAAGLLMGLAVLALSEKSPAPRAAENREALRRPVEAVPAPPAESRPLPPPARPATEPPSPPVRPLPTPAASPKAEEPAPAAVPEPPHELPRPEERRPEEPPRPRSQTVVARALSEVQITDITGALNVHRKGAKFNERLTGVTRLSEGDVVSAEKTASFRVDGRHPVVLMDNASISMAYVAQEQAPWLRLHSGEALVDSTAPVRWVVTDGSESIAVKPARARFTAARGESRFAIASLSEPLYLQPDGGDMKTLRPGEELQMGRASADIRPLEAGVAARLSAAFESGRPRTRTIFYTSCDPADAKREHFFVQEGNFKNDALQGHDRGERERVAVAAIGPNPRFAWRATLTLRFRVLTNCKSLEVQMRVEDRKYTLWKVLPLDHRNKDPWITLELPLDVTSPLFRWQFRRDDGINLLTVTMEDKFDSLRFVARQSEVIGEQRPLLLVDDIQVTDRE